MWYSLRCRSILLIVYGMMFKLQIGINIRESENVSCGGFFCVLMLEIYSKIFWQRF